MAVTFSNRNRSEIRSTLATTAYDVVIVGGGATGAGILLDATVRGMNAALIDMQDFAAGTSSRSTKLVHGGLRYLKQLEISLVAEVGKERAIVYENGPHVTTPEWMLLPIVKGGTYGKLASSFGIRLYDFLAGVKRSERRQMLSYAETLAAEPLLNQGILKGAGRYVEYRTDDARLTLEILKEAVSRGAHALNYAKATSFVYTGQQVSGVEVIDVLTGEEWTIQAKKVVNATGPWVDGLRELDRSKTGKTLHLTKGVHIVVDGNRFPLKNPVYFDVPDGRMVFAIPRDGKVYIGTTDTNYQGDLIHPRMTRADRAYLVDAANYMFPTVALTEDDVESSWAGVRPLIHEEGKGPSEISRRDEVFRSQSGLITIAGGKLTGYRKMAESVVDVVATELQAEAGLTFVPCTTQSIPISGGRVGGGTGFSGFVAKHVPEGIECGLSEAQARRLAVRYGSNVERVFQILRDESDKVAESGLDPEVYCTLVYAIHHEMVYRPEDFFTRRTGSTYFRVDWAKRWLDPVTRFMGETFNWTEEDTETQIVEGRQRIREATDPVD